MKIDYRADHNQYPGIFKKYSTFELFKIWTESAEGSLRALNFEKIIYGRTGLSGDELAEIFKNES